MAKHNIGKPKIQNKFWYQFFASFPLIALCIIIANKNIYCDSVDFLESNTKKKRITDVKNEAKRFRATTKAIAK